MKAIQVTCPQCGARLAAGDAARVTCEYCGTEAHVQRRSRVLERVEPTRPPPGMRVAVQQRSAAPILAVAALVVVLGAIILGISAAVHQAASTTKPTGGGGTTPAPGRILGWEGDMGGGVLMTDADGDGDVDVIGRCREYGNVDAVSIIALDGATGATLWESPALGTYIETYQGLLGLAGDTIVFTNELGEVRGYAVAGGARRWSAQLPERAATLCAGDGTVGVVGNDGVRRDVRLADGKPPAEAPAAADCVPLPHDHEGGHPRLRHIDAPYELAGTLGLQRASLAVGPGGRVVSGERDKGTRVARLVALDGERDTARWSVDVAAQPLAAHEGAPELVAVGDDVACASYEPSASQSVPRLACFDLATGARRWDQELLDDSPLEGLFITEVGVMIAQWGLLEVRDPATGALRWKFGKP